LAVNKTHISAQESVRQGREKKAVYRLKDLPTTTNGMDVIFYGCKKSHDDVV
jgi:hypothetical protein